MADETRPLKARRVGFEKERGVLAVQTEALYAFLCIGLESGERTSEPQEAAALRMLRPLAERGVKIRFFRIHPGSLSFVASMADLDGVHQALAAAGAPVEAIEGCAVVTVVAPNVRSIPAIMARMGKALQARGVHVYQTADSHSSVSCVIPGEEVDAATESLRGEFGLAEEDGA